ncbi:MAG TPA: hypothetical protein VND64_01580 [Pirellulales bacterium]|nr:hypothetical protein [Pirellulales bacterium]
MATVDLTLSQIIDAVRQLPAAQRERLLKEIVGLPEPDTARRAAQRIRGTYRLPTAQRRRMSELLVKGNAGTLTAVESDELDHLVDEFERKTLEMAESLAAAAKAEKKQNHSSQKRRRSST